MAWRSCCSSWGGCARGGWRRRRRRRRRSRWRWTAIFCGASWDRLRDLANLAQRFRPGQGLLDAISVENIYANLSRTARERGFPRQPSQPATRYLPDLVRAFPGCADEATRITNAYERVHYGDRRPSAEELAQVRADYKTMQASVQAEAAASTATAQA